MPGTLLPHDVLDELTGVAGLIVGEVGELDGADFQLHDRLQTASYPIEHAIDVTVIGLLLGRSLVPRDGLEELGMGLFLQDIGKLALPQRLVHKAGPLAPDEWELMMQHTVLGLQFLRDERITSRTRAVVRHHHERWDGSGYPDELAGAEIPLFARIAAVADVFDAVTSRRRHAPAASGRVGIDVLRAGAGKTFDPEVVGAFLEVLPADRLALAAR
jgi:HD-GYP domain-containing protein (c-di-GMP phosphodiesterase class II)